MKQTQLPSTPPPKSMSPVRLSAPTSQPPPALSKPASLPMAASAPPHSSQKLTRLFQAPLPSSIPLSLAEGARAPVPTLLLRPGFLAIKGQGSPSIQTAMRTSPAKRSQRASPRPELSRLANPFQLVLTSPSSTPPVTACSGPLIWAALTATPATMIEPLALPSIVLVIRTSPGWPSPPTSPPLPARFSLLPRPSASPSSRKSIPPVVPSSIRLLWVGPRKSTPPETTSVARRKAQAGL